MKNYAKIAAIRTLKYSEFMEKFKGYPESLNGALKTPFFADVNLPIRL